MSEMRYDGRVAIVTGAGAGLGRAYAELLASRGAKVLVNDLGPDIRGEGAGHGPADEVTRAINDAGGEAIANYDSVATSEGGRNIVAQAMEAWGQVDIVINNAGVTRSKGPIDENTDDQFLHDLLVGAGGPFFILRNVWRHMWERDYGRIITTASGSFYGTRSAVGYPASKGGAWAIARSLAHVARHNGKNIHANCIMPTAAGRMTQLMGEDIAAKMREHFMPSTAAGPVAYLVHEDCEINGEMFRVGGDRMKRVFIGQTPGYAAEKNGLTIERVRDNIDQVMSLDDGFIIPRNNTESLIDDDRVPWEKLNARAI